MNCHYPFMNSLNRCDKSCNTLNDLSDRICFPNKTKDARINDSKTLTKNFYLVNCESN